MVLLINTKWIYDHITITLSIAYVFYFTKIGEITKNNYAKIIFFGELYLSLMKQKYYDKANH